MDNISSTSIQEILEAGRIVEARTLLTMHAAAFSEKERSMLVEQLDRLYAEAEALVVQAESLETEGQTQEAKTLYESALLLAVDFPELQSHIKRTEESLALTRAVRLRSQRLRKASQVGRKTPRKNIPRSLLATGLTVCVIAGGALLFFLKTPQPIALSEKTMPAIPVQIAAPQPADPPARADTPAPNTASLAVTPGPPTPTVQENAPEEKPTVAEPAKAPEITELPASPPPASPPEKTLPPATVQPSPAVPEPSKEAVYTVHPGDSLSLIASQQFCDQEAWKKIHALNRERVNDPNKLQPGMQLQLKGIKSRCPSAP